MSKSCRKELDQVEFTKLLVNIYDDITQLFKLYEKGRIELKVITEFRSAFDVYVDSSHSFKDYMAFKKQALYIKDTNMYKIDKPDTKQIVCNILLGIVGLGVIYGLAVGINYLLNDKALFFKPEAVNGIDVVINDVDALKNNIFAAKFN
ncbi:MAG: hypothetical protein Q8M03_01640 [Legionella sp.]|nr:hypothetical protein [Legionella sp.]